MNLTDSSRAETNVATDSTAYELKMVQERSFNEKTNDVATCLDMDDSMMGLSKDDEKPKNADDTNRSSQTSYLLDSASYLNNLESAFFYLQNKVDEFKGNYIELQSLDDIVALFDTYFQVCCHDCQGFKIIFNLKKKPCRICLRMM